MSISNYAVVHDSVLIPSSVKIGEFVCIHEGAFISEHCTVHGFTQVWPGVKLDIGASLGSSVVLEQPSKAKNQGILFGKNCEVGAAAVICQGVVIGEGAVVRPASVVGQDVPPYAIVSGAPARVLGYVESIEGGRASTWPLLANFPSSPSVVRLGVGDATLHRLKSVYDPRGDLSVGEFPVDIPFEPKRYFLVFNVPSEKVRGEHAHHQCHQFLICVKGSCAAVLDDGKSRCEILLDSPDLGVYLPPLTWGTQYKYSSDAVLLVFASHLYNSADYIRNYAEFVQSVRAKAIP